MLPLCDSVCLAALRRSNVRGVAKLGPKGSRLRLTSRAKLGTALPTNPSQCTNNSTEPVSPSTGIHVPGSGLGTLPLVSGLFLRLLGPEYNLPSDIMLGTPLGISEKLPLSLRYSHSLLDRMVDAISSVRPPTVACGRATTGISRLIWIFLPRGINASRLFKSVALKRQSVLASFFSSALTRCLRRCSYSLTTGIFTNDSLSGVSVSAPEAHLPL